MPSHTIKEREKKRSKIRKKTGTSPGEETSKRGLAVRLKRRKAAKRKKSKTRKQHREVVTGTR